MSQKNLLNRLCKTTKISWFDLIILILILMGGAFYLHDALYWGVGWVGESQYGDAEFWWNGALHIAQGLFKDNPGIGYRPGYFYLTGLTLPVLGEQFQQFYPYFLLTFLSATGFFYLALRQILGNWIAACVVGTLIFNPYTAEWLATSTTDGTGLLLNLLALSCLLFGVHKKLTCKWLMAFGFLFFLSTLTRPLMTPFIGVVLIFICFYRKESLKNRLFSIASVFIAFTLPTLLWMGFQKLTIDQWTISSNDASAFYAASDPHIQVWIPSMYTDIRKIAANRYHLPLNKINADVNNPILNQIFWQETIKNYIKHPIYHIKRAIPHLIEIARFGPLIATHGNDHWRVALFEIIILGLSFVFFIQRNTLCALAFLILGVCLYFSSKVIILMVLAGAILGLLKKDKNNQPAMFLLSAYWLTGVVALYLVGGTSRPPSYSILVAINSLGYRLGSQFFFVGDILMAYFILSLAQYKLKTEKYSVINGVNFFLSRPNFYASSIVGCGLAVFVFAAIMIYVIGGTMVAYRAYTSSHSTGIEAFPSLSPIIDAYEYHTKTKLIQTIGRNGELDSNISSNFRDKSRQYDIIFTGIVSPFIWNIPGQKRTQLKIYIQNNVSPFTMGPKHIIIDVPQRLNPADWRGKKGAFIIRDLPDIHNKSNQAYYLTHNILRTFIPLSEDTHHFSLSKAISFPIIKNASQLKKSGELTIPAAQITWALNSGVHPFQRRFFVTPQKINPLMDGRIILYLDTSAINAQGTLNFSYEFGDISMLNQSNIENKHINIKIYAIDNTSKKSHKKLILPQNVITTSKKEDALNKVHLSIPPGTKTIEIAFNHLSANKGIWFYEFNLSAPDFNHLTANADNI